MEGETNEAFFQRMNSVSDESQKEYREWRKYHTETLANFVLYNWQTKVEKADYRGYCSTNIFNHHPDDWWDGEEFVERNTEGAISVNSLLGSDRPATQPVRRNALQSVIDIVRKEVYPARLRHFFVGVRRSQTTPWHTVIEIDWSQVTGQEPVETTKQSENIAFYMSLATKGGGEPDEGVPEEVHTAPKERRPQAPEKPGEPQTAETYHRSLGDAMAVMWEEKVKEAVKRGVKEACLFSFRSLKYWNGSRVVKDNKDGGVAVKRLLGNEEEWETRGIQSALKRLATYTKDLVDLEYVDTPVQKVLARWTTPPFEIEIDTDKTQGEGEGGNTWADMMEENDKVNVTQQE